MNTINKSSTFDTIVNKDSQSFIKALMQQSKVSDVTLLVFLILVNVRNIDVVISYDIKDVTPVYELLPKVCIE